MILWLKANAGTIVICAILIAAVALIIAGDIKNKRQGKSSCSCGCSGCALSEKCHGK